MGRGIGSAGGGITSQIKKKAESARILNAYTYLIMDAQLNIQNRALVSEIRKMLTMLEPHTALFVVPTGVGRTHLAMDLLE